MVQFRLTTYNLEFMSATDCKLYGPKGELLQDVIIKGDVPTLNPCENELSFTYDGTKDISSRVQVTVIEEGEPLVKR